MPTLALWQRSPVGQSPSAAQYFRHTTPPSGRPRHALPLWQGMFPEHAVPTPPSPLSGRHATRAVLPWQPKSHSLPAEQFWSAGSQPLPLTSGALSSRDPTSVPASAPAVFAAPQAVAVSATTIASATITGDAVAAGVRMASNPGLLLPVAELEAVVQRAHGELGVLGVDHARDLDLGGGDEVDVDVLAGEDLEQLQRDAGVVAHADADDRHLREIGLRLDLLRRAEIPAVREQQLLRAREVGRGQREGQVGAPVLHERLHDARDRRRDRSTSPRRPPSRSDRCETDAPLAPNPS